MRIQFRKYIDIYIPAGKTLHGEGPKETPFLKAISCDRGPFRGRLLSVARLVAVHFMERAKGFGPKQTTTAKFSQRGGEMDPLRHQGNADLVQWATSPSATDRAPLTPEVSPRRAGSLLLSSKHSFSSRPIPSFRLLYGTRGRYHDEGTLPYSAPLLLPIHTHSFYPCIQ